jgi:hypothetical protein
MRRPVGRFSTAKPPPSIASRSYGKCLDGGIISVNLVVGRLAWNWSGAGGVTVIAVLERTGR